VLKTLIKRYVLGAMSRAMFQPIYEQMLRLSLLGMNVGAGGDVDSSGEAPFLRAVARLFRCEAGPLVVVDGGANVGDYTNAVLKAMGDRVVVLAFEPSDKTFARLRANVRNSAGVRFFQHGLSERQETLTLFSNAEASGLASLYEHDLRHEDTTLSARERVSLRPLDDVLDETGIGHIHLLKLDMEGHELSARRGARRAVDEGRIDLIQFEFGGCNIDSRSYLRDFHNLLGTNYVLHRLLRGGLRKLPRYAETQESFLTTNYIAVRPELIEPLRRVL
jgi:FkbM family methyltransferase